MSRKQQTEPYNFDSDSNPKIYKADKEYMKCPQSELSDEYGTVEEVVNAMHYYDKRLDEGTCLFTNSISLLIGIQKGISNEKMKILGIEKRIHYKGEKIADPQELANLVHHYLDWLRATRKRTWDSRPLNSMRTMLDACWKGLWVQGSTLLHYHENPNRY